MAEGRVPICPDCHLPFGWRLLSDCRCEQNLLHRRIADLMDRIEKLRPLAYRCEAHEGYMAGCPCCDASEVGRLTEVLEGFRDHGLRADLHPTIMGRGIAEVVAHLYAYIGRLDASVRGRAHDALAGRREKRIEEELQTDSKPPPGPERFIREAPLCPRREVGAEDGKPEDEAKITSGRVSALMGMQDFLEAANEGLRAEVVLLEGALQEIKREQGKVCVNFELCRHEGCRSSYASWAIADAALAERPVKPPAKVPTTWVQITEGFVPCNHVGMMERYAALARCGNCTAQWAPGRETD